MARRYEQAERLREVRYEPRGANMVEAQRMEAAGERILKLNIGNLAPFGFEAPEAMVRSVVDHLPESEGYSDSKGVLSARTAVATYYQKAGLAVDVDQVWLGNGVSELIAMVLQSLVNPGDEVLIPAPDYPLWTGQTTLCGAKAVYYLCDEANGWNPDVADMAAKITERTRAVVLINPNNPTGAVYSREVVQQVVDLARAHDLVVLSDEIYEKIIFEGTHTYTASLTGDDVLCLTFSGLSKAYRACGYRAGWCVVTGPLESARSLLDGLTLLANMRMCSNVPAQHAIQAALEDRQSVDALCVPGGRFHDQLTVAHEMLTQIPGVTCQPAKGALYLFPRLEPDVYAIEDDEAWALGLLHQQKILVAHGRGFNWPDPDHFRLVALPETAVLVDAIGRIGDYLATLR